LINSHLTSKTVELLKELFDQGLFPTKEALLAHFATSYPSPMEVITKIAAMLRESTHLREQAS
jgi:hypothetical protein